VTPDSPASRPVVERERAGEPCERCCLAGYIEVPRIMYVTRDMAIDACDRSLEGQPIEWGTDREECPDCNGTGLRSVTGETPDE
jgi:hypothetical protein